MFDNEITLVSFKKHLIERPCSRKRSPSMVIVESLKYFIRQRNWEECGLPLEERASGRAQNLQTRRGRDVLLKSCSWVGKITD